MNFIMINDNSGIQAYHIRYTNLEPFYAIYFDIFILYIAI